MNTMRKFKLQEDIKTRFHILFEKNEKWKNNISEETLESVGTILAKVIEQYEEMFKKEENGKSAVTYLFDVIGYYIALNHEMIELNSVLLDELEKYTEDL